MKHESKIRHPSRQDDLQRIKGIGPIIERQLLKAGINSFASLAKQTPNSLADLVPDLSPKQLRIQDWIDQAKKLLPRNSDKSIKHNSLTIPSQQRYATFNLELLLDRSNRVRRTQIVHVQSGEKNQWAAWDEARLTSYIAQQSHIKLPTQKKVSQVELRTLESSGEAQPPLPTPEADRSPAIDISPFSILLNKAKLLPQTTQIHVEIEFELTGPKATDIASRHTRFCVEIVACDLITARAAVITSVDGMLQTDQLRYCLSLEFRPPGVGRYQLEIITFLPDEDAIAIQLGPILTVIP
jgi:helix-hairpin-helix protein